MSHAPTSLPASREHDGTDCYANLNGLRFHYVSWGDPRKPPLVCLHGLRSYGRTFSPLAAALADRFFVLAIDQRGRGETAWDPDRNYYTDQYVADLGAFVDHLGLEIFHLLGHSMGGIASIVYASAHSNRLLSLILEDSGPGASNNSAGAARINAELAATPSSFPDWASARRFWRSIRPNVTDAAIDSRLANSLRETPRGVEWKHDQAGIAACRLRPDPTRVTPDLWPFIDALRCDTLVVRGADSDYLSAGTFAEMMECNPRLHGREVAGAGHYIHDDQPEAFLHVVSEFLSTNRMGE